jgi:peptide/nickel transport system substrate-binding protein
VNLQVEVGFGVSGRATCNLVPAPLVYASPNTDYTMQDMDGAKKLLDNAGRTVAAGRIGETDG